MKKVTLCLMTMGLLLIIQPHTLKASVDLVPAALVAPACSEPELTTTLLNRLYQIDDMDKSNLKPFEKRKLRIEVRSIKSQLRVSGGGLYISAGAVILIVILLLILF